MFSPFSSVQWPVSHFTSSCWLLLHPGLERFILILTVYLSSTSFPEIDVDTETNFPIRKVEIIQFVECHNTDRRWSWTVPNLYSYWYSMSCVLVSNLFCHVFLVLLHSTQHIGQKQIFLLLLWSFLNSWDEGKWWHINQKVSNSYSWKQHEAPCTCRTGPLITGRSLDLLPSVLSSLSSLSSWDT